MNDIPPYKAKELWIAHNSSMCELLHMHLFLPETDCSWQNSVYSFWSYVEIDTPAYFVVCSVPMLFFIDFIFIILK